MELKGLAITMGLGAAAGAVSVIDYSGGGFYYRLPGMVGGLCGIRRNSFGGCYHYCPDDMEPSQLAKLPDVADCHDFI